MSSNFNLALDKIRSKSSNTVEQGTAFEKLSKIFFENDDIQKHEFDKVWLYKDWAKKNPSFSKTDIGIDLVGELKDNKGLAAIQCKFFKADHQISKEDLDSFISASSNQIFTRLILIDTSNEDLGVNAKSMIDNLNKTYQRIQKYDLQNSRIDWLYYVENEKVNLSNKKDPLDHQIQAITEAKKHYLSNDRGKMIMACGTGKTYTSLKIAEAIAHKKFILYMVPSLSLMSQSIREWKNDCTEDFTAFSACSDKKVGKIKNDTDQIQVKLNELAIPATTNSKNLSEEIFKVEKNKMIVVFSTYQSIDVISDAQKKFGMSSFDLIICDEAHRTTGATFEDQEDSYFVRIHEDKYVEGKKRLYMTATPRIFGNKAKKKADEGRVELASMDDPKKYGEEFFNRGFNWAVENNLLSDYKVVILAIDEGMVSSNLQKSLEDGSELKLTDATKIIGVYKALAKVGFDKKENEELKPIKKALAFTQSIEISKIFEKEFSNVVSEYVKNENIKDDHKVDLNVNVQHIDGSFNADQRTNRLDWLKSDTEDKTCRILSNVRCLSEGVDVPSLDAIMFLHPKKSQIDVVQAVGRVMRKAEGKDLGYVIIPVTVAPGVSPEKALNDNEKYRVVWQIVNALRTHDERLDSKVNMLSLGEDISDKIEIVTMSAEKDATTAKVEDVSEKKQKKNDSEDELININENNQEKNADNSLTKEQMSFELDDLSQAIKAKIVQKCGTRDYWENWATDISKIAKKHIENLNSILVKKKTKERKSFDRFLKEIQDDLNPEVNEKQAIEMLAQHIITKPVFDSLFSDNQFTKLNTVSRALDKVISSIYKKSYVNHESLENFYSSVERRSKDIVTTAGRQKLILELYDRFFKNAFPDVQKKLGIVYTPIEIVDFIINSIEYVLKDEFNKSLSKKNVEILDPFAGTGTFITRLLQSKHIDQKTILNKYQNEIHFNEIVLLAYYIAGINIESVFHDIYKPNSFESFSGSVLTDTFQLYEQERDLIADLLPDNSKKRTNQKNKKITVIFGNPPYSSGQKSADDMYQKMKYPNLDQKIFQTYGKNSKSINQSGLYDSYIRAFRWASDRIDKTSGVVAFITGSSWIDKTISDGLRKTLTEEFSSIYVINLRGDVRKDILSKGNSNEGENVFGQASMTGIAITFLIKNKSLKEKGAKIKYFDIGNNLKEKDKLSKLKNLNSIETIEKKGLFKTIFPDENNDWINKGNKNFKNYKSIGEKKQKIRNSIFAEYTNGIITSRDAWCYNSSKKKLINNIKNTVEFYNTERKRIQKLKLDSSKIKDYIKVDPQKISWSRGLLKNIIKNNEISFDEKKIRTALYRPFEKRYLYFDKDLNEVSFQNIKLFPNTKEKNLSILLPGVGGRSGFSCLVTDCLADFHVLDSNQCFPMHTYKDLDQNDKDNNNQSNLFSNTTIDKNDFRKDNITDYYLNYIQQKYKKKDINKEDIFSYTYAVLHHEEYKLKFKNNLVKELPRVPNVQNYKQFTDVSDIGKKLINLHLNYEKIKPYEFEVAMNNFDSVKSKIDYFEIEKNYSKRFHNSEIQFNKNISIKNIPPIAYEYILNGKSAIEWFFDRRFEKKDKKSGISNDPYDFIKLENNPDYFFQLLKKIITISVETQKLIKKLPELEIN